MRPVARLDDRRISQPARKDLETRVRERTAQLEAANLLLRAEIDKRQRAEQSLRQSEARYRHLVENVNEVIFTVDAGGCVTYVSSAIERVAGGRPAAEVLGRPFLDFVHPDDVTALVASFQRALEGHPEPLEYRVIGNDAQVYWIRSHSQAIIEGGRVVAVQGVLTDVTERREAEMEAHRRREELAHVQRLTTAGAMTAEIAHQISQPLASIINFAGGLAARAHAGDVDAATLRQVSGRIADEAGRVSEVIQRLRAFLRKGERVVRPCDLNQLITHVLRLLEEDFRRAAVEVHLDLDRALPRCQLDAILIEQVVLNLLRNALDAMVDVEQPHRLDIRTRLEGGMVQVTVSDTGAGVPADARLRIFDAFFTTKPCGLGLGLSVSRSIICASGGRLWMETNPPRGTTVAFTVPLAQMQ